MLVMLWCDGKLLRILKTSLEIKIIVFRIYTDIVDLQQQDSLSMSLLRAAHKFKLSGLMGESSQEPLKQPRYQFLELSRYHRPLRTCTRFIGECSLVCFFLLCRWRSRRRKPFGILFVADFYPLGWTASARLHPHVRRFAVQNAESKDKASTALGSEAEEGRRGVSVPGGERWNGELIDLRRFLRNAKIKTSFNFHWKCHGSLQHNSP